MNNITDKEFGLIRDYIKNNYGISLGDEKKSLIFSRLRSVLQEKGFSNFTEYYDYLVSDRTGEATTVFIDKMTTNHTFFMREVEHFYYFRDKVLPELEKTIPSNDIRIWCAGCSSGEESCTLEIIMNEYFKNKSVKWDTELLATDISTSVLDKAVFGVYSKEQIAPLSDEWKKRYFMPYDEHNVIISDEIKSKITYRKFNLMENSFNKFKKKFNVIFCRNVMIYFDAPTRQRVVQNFYDVSEHGAYLFIGHSESLNNTDTKYKYVMPALYRKE